MNPETLLLKPTERYVMFIGDVVAICWNAKEVKTKVTTGGAEHHSVSWEKEGEPYIDFLRLHYDGEYYEDKDSPVVGGFDTDYARKIATELLQACEWLENNQ